MLSVGNTFLVPTPPNNVEHLYIIIAIRESSNSALVVNVTSLKVGCDYTCIVKFGEHRFVKHDSIINYADASIRPISNIEYCLTKGIFKKDTSVSAKLLKRIQDGALQSPAISRKNLNFVKSNI